MSKSSLLAPLSLAIALTTTGCNGAFVGNFIVLGMTLGVFFGTLGLGRVRPSPRMPSAGSAERSDMGERQG